MRTTILLAALACVSTAAAQNVKVTPLGSHAGELCARDRATLFEDPTGVRILYDAGHSLIGADDPRLGNVHAVLVSHAHGDHIGDQKLKALEAGTCATPELVSAAPNSTSAEVAAAKNSALVMIGQMAGFLGKKVETIKGRPTANCPETNEVITAPLAAACTAGVNLGGSRLVKVGDGKPVEITVVFASHDSTMPRTLLSEAERKNLDADNVSLVLGPPSGYVIRFTNGLVVYLSGDTGMHTEMKTVVHDYHKANLMVLNLGYSALNAPAAGHIANDLVAPASVIVSHVNEAGSVGGKVKPLSHTAAFVAQVKGRPVHLALSGKTMEFDGSGKCVGGCQAP